MIALPTSWGHARRSSLASRSHGSSPLVTIDGATPIAMLSGGAAIG